MAAQIFNRLGKLTLPLDDEPRGLSIALHVVIPLVVWQQQLACNPAPS